MNRQEFLQDQDVVNFIGWLGCALPQLEAELAIRSSRFVKGGLRLSASNIDDVLSHYQWGQNWQQTKKRIAGFRYELAEHLVSTQPNQKLLLQTCLAILAWGGDRNAEHGATPFLLEKGENNSLADYLRQAQTALCLSTADTGRLQRIERMNSMLTKVHAFVAEDGLPIYDSRVAAAIAALVELYRRHTQATWREVPAALTFPALSPARTVSRLAPDALDHGFMRYDAQSWAAAKLRLGWLLHAVLENNVTLLSEEGSLAQRMHALEACLFMLGYDVACLVNNLGHSDIGPLLQTDRLGQEGANGQAVEQAQGRNYQCFWSEAIALNKIRKTFTLSRKNPVSYVADTSVGCLIRYAEGIFLFIDQEDIRVLLEEFAGRTIALGAKQDQGFDIGEFSLGNWLIHPERQISRSRRHASHLAPILCAEYGVQHCEAPAGKQGVYLKFPTI